MTMIGRSEAARRWPRRAAVLAGMLFVCAEADAFDGAREGFQADLDVGLGASSIEFGAGGVVRRNEDDGRGPVVNLRLGVGFSERFALHLASHFGSHARSGAPDYGFTVLGLGASWWVHPAGTGSAYVSAMLGAALLSTDDPIPGGVADNRDDARGAGFSAAVGYEFANRVRVEAALRGLAVDGGFVPNDDELSLGGVYLAIGYGWY